MNFRYHPAFSPLPASNPFPVRTSADSSRRPAKSPHPRARLSRTSRTPPISAPNPCIIRTYKNRSRNCFRIRTYAPPSDLRILKDLPSPIFPRNPFIFCTYRPPRICGKQTTYNPFRIRTYKISARNSFRIRTYKNHRGSISLGTPPPPASRLLGLRFRFRSPSLADRRWVLSFSFTSSISFTSSTSFIFTFLCTLPPNHPVWGIPRALPRLLYVPLFGTLDGVSLSSGKGFRS